MKAMFQHINRKQLAIHLLFWLAYMVSEYFANLMHMQPGKNWRFFQATFLSLPALVLPTYFIAYYVVPKFLKNGKWPLFLWWTILCAVFIFYARLKWTELVVFLEEDRYFKMPAAKVLKNVIRDYSIVALAVCVYIIGDYRQKQKQNEELIKAKAEAEIKLLKGQLHPHFLFNSLNNIYSLALTKSDLTADSILKLTGLLDYLVYRANMDKVAISKEVELIENYIGLEQLRYGEKLKISSDIVVLSNEIKIAPLLLLPFAENCFKHGGVGPDGFFRIEIYLRADQQKLTFHISNTKKNGKANQELNGGVGLDNIRKRLTLLYPNRHQLSISNLPDLYTVKLEITFKNEKI